MLRRVANAPADEASKSISRSHRAHRDSVAIRMSRVYLRCIDASSVRLQRGLVIKRWLAFLVAAQLSVINADGSEVCHFVGTSDYRGRIDITTAIDTKVMNATTTVDVRGRFTGMPIPFVHITYLMQEIRTLES